jgi:deoxyribodipyrimidine photo-lyase
MPGQPTLPSTVPFVPGEAEAQRRLDLTGTSQLWPYLRFGMLSARQAVVTALEALDLTATAQAQDGAITWLNELIWREFYISILYHFPHVRQRSFRPSFDHLAWADDEAAFAAWRAGRTGSRWSMRPCGNWG